MPSLVKMIWKPNFSNRVCEAWCAILATLDGSVIDGKEFERKKSLSERKIFVKIKRRDFRVR